MGKLKVIPGQESFPIESELGAQEPFNVISYLNDREGFIELEDLPDFEIDWSRELTYLEFMGEIGVALAEESPRSEIWDKPLGAHGEDFQNISIQKLTPELYFSSGASRRRIDVVTVSNGTPTLDAPGVRSRKEGVAVTGNEFRLIARSAEDLAKHVYAQTEHANEKRPLAEKLDNETLRNTAGRSVIHAMDERTRTLLTLDTALKIEREAAHAINTLAIGGNDAPKVPMGELDIYRRISMVAILGAAKVAFNQLGYGTNRREGAMRALVSAFTRGEPEKMAAVARGYTKWAGYYVDAKRGKVYQSLSTCKEVHERHEHFIYTKKPDSIAA